MLSPYATAHVDVRSEGLNNERPISIITDLDEQGLDLGLRLAHLQLRTKIAKHNDNSIQLTGKC